MSVDTFGDGDQDDATHDDASQAGEVEGGRYYPVARRGHPPLLCPRPSIVPSATGWYRCPCCGRKARHVELPTPADSAAETVAPAIDAAGEIIRQSIVTLVIWTARAIAWMALAAWHLITRHRQEGNTDGIVDHDGQEDGPGAQSEGQSAPQDGEEEPEKDQDKEEDPRVLTCTTSDGMHVMTISDGNYKCMVCGLKMAWKAA